MNKAQAREVASRLESRGFVATIREEPGERIGAVCYSYVVTAHCDSCAAISVQGRACHERGCPDAREYECWECGCVPVKHPRALCDDCYQSNGYADA